MIRPSGDGHGAPAPALEECLALHQAGRLAEAEDCYRRRLQRHPGEPELQHLFGLLRAQQGLFEEGSHHLQQAVAACPEVPLYQFNLAMVCLEGGDNERALAALTRCRELSPAYGGVSLGLGRALAALGRYGPAVEALEEAAHEDDDGLEALLVLGELHLQHAFFDRAVATLDRVRSLAGDQPEILRSLARACEAAQDPDRALDLYRTLAAAGDPAVAGEIARLEELRRIRLEAQEFADELEGLATSIRQGREPAEAAWRALIARADAARRSEATRRLVRACLEQPERAWRERARRLVEQAWPLSGYADDLLPLYLEVLTALADVAGIRAAYDRAGIEAAKRRQFGKALRYFEQGWTGDRPG